MFETHALNHDLEEHKAPSMMSAEIILPLSANEVRLHLSVFLSLATLSFFLSHFFLYSLFLPLAFSLLVLVLIPQFLPFNHRSHGGNLQREKKERE